MYGGYMGYIALCGGYGGYDGEGVYDDSVWDSGFFEFVFDCFSSVPPRSRFQSSSSEPIIDGTMCATTPGVPAAFKIFSKFTSITVRTHQELCMMGLVIDRVTSTGPINL